MQSGNSMHCRADAAGQLNSMLYVSLLLAAYKFRIECQRVKERLREDCFAPIMSRAFSKPSSLLSFDMALSAKNCCRYSDLTSKSWL
jgi:hypothetical protein